MQSEDRVEREQALRRAVLAGEEHAWRMLYDEAFTGLYAYVLWRCAGLRDRADEVVQETWLTAVRRIRSFDPSAGSFAAWLRGIAANAIRNLTRRRDRRRTQPLNGQAASSAVAVPPCTSSTASRSRSMPATPSRWSLCVPCLRAGIVWAVITASYISAGLLLGRFWLLARRG